MSPKTDPTPVRCLYCDALWPEDDATEPTCCVRACLDWHMYRSYMEAKP